MMMQTEEKVPFRIRAVREQDAEELLEIYAPYVRETAVSFEYEVPDPEEFRGRIRNTLKRYPYLAAEKNGKILGYAYASAFHARAAYDWAVETSIYVRRDSRRTGVGAALYEALEEALKRQNILNLNACIAYPSREDSHLTLDSVRFHEKMGYQICAHFHQCGYKFDTWYDCVWMEKHLGIHEKHPVPVEAFQAEGD